MLDLPSTIWIARREYLRHDGREQVESIVTSVDLIGTVIDLGYEVTQYVRTSTQPFRRRPLTETEAIQAGEWSAHREEHEAGLFCDACFRDGALEHCTGYYFDPATEEEGHAPR